MAAPLSERPEGQKHMFRLAYGVLALAFWISVAGFVVLIVRPNHSKPIVWSAWKPDTQGLPGAREISLRVASQYRGANGVQLVAVQPHGAQVQGLRLEAIGVRRLSSGGQIDPYIGMYGTDKTLIYAFCGLQTNCGVQGESTPERERALRRAALELSLYSFKYLKGVDQVVSLVQSVKSGGTSAVFLRKDDLIPELRHPLRDTLPLAAAPAADAKDAVEAPVIDALTLSNTFPAHFEPLPDGDAILVLDVENQVSP
ncbi:MAG: hypothetical protein HOQ28_05055 [Thermoleophilia bacterium]|nr:hypothetical protein [Thermoleophilia bacterium]